MKLKNPVSDDQAIPNSSKMVRQALTVSVTMPKKTVSCGCTVVANACHSYCARQLLDWRGLTADNSWRLVTSVPLHWNERWLVTGDSRRCQVAEIGSGETLQACIYGALGNMVTEWLSGGIRPAATQRKLRVQAVLWFVSFSADAWPCSSSDGAVLACYCCLPETDSRQTGCWAVIAGIVIA